MEFRKSRKKLCNRDIGQLCEKQLRGQERWAVNYSLNLLLGGQCPSVQKQFQGRKREICPDGSELNGEVMSLVIFSRSLARKGTRRIQKSCVFHRISVWFSWLRISDTDE